MKYNWDKDNIEKALINSNTLSDILRNLGVPIRGNNISTLHRYIKKYGIDITCLNGRQYPKDAGSKRYVPVINYLNETTHITASKLRLKLIKENIKENKCEICGITQWNNKPIVIQLHHKNGNRLDNRIENLQMLCPNCHSQTDNYCGSANKNKEINRCIICGKEILKTSTYCTKCGSENRRKLIVSREELIKDMKNLKSYRAVGRKYGVSDNTIRKRINKK